ATGQQRGRARGHLGRVAGEMADQDVGVDKCGQPTECDRWWRVRRVISSQGVPRLAAGTATLPASSRKLGVLAITARDRSTRQNRFVAFVEVQRAVWRRAGSPSGHRTQLWVTAGPNLVEFRDRCGRCCPTGVVWGPAVRASPGT